MEHRLSEHVRERTVVRDNGDGASVNEWVENLDSVDNSKCLSLGGFVLDIVFVEAPAGARHYVLMLVSWIHLCADGADALLAPIIVDDDGEVGV